MATGHYISGIGHGALLAWLLIGGLFSHVPEDAIEVAEVSIISSEDFAALSAPRPSPDPVTPTPPQPEIETPPEPPVAETPPAVPDTPVRETPPPAEEAPDVIEAPTPLVETPPVVQPPAPTPPVETPPVVLAPPATTSSPRPAPRVAPTPVEAPPPDVEVADEPREAVTPDAETPRDPEPLEENPAAPEETNDRIVTEADAPPSSAPTRSARPSARPSRPTPPVETVSATNSTRDAIADALAGVQQETTPAPSSAPTGPPLTGGEKDAFLVDVRRCWNVGALSTAALQAKVVVRFELSREGKPDVGSIQMTGHEGASQAVAKQAYETARRAIIRCGATGYKLPIEKYEQWKIVNITFNPENMRLK